MRRFAWPAVFSTVVVAFLVLLAVGISDSGYSKSLDYAIDHGKPALAPDANVSLQTVHGGRLDVDDYRGRFVLVNFFASWCSACQVEAPLINQAQRMLRARGGTVIGVNYQDNDPADISYAKQYHVSYPLLGDPNQTLASAYGVNGIPESFLVSPAGRVIALNRGEITGAWVNVVANDLKSAS
jgi:cytochrome c biogenesis protein CcmG/thiol:disulfide interchange protein DsbE